MSAVSLSFAVSRFLDYLRPRVAKSTLQLHQHYLKRFQESIGEKTIDSVTRLDCEMFSNRKHPLSTLRRFFKWAMDVAEWITKDPTEKIDVPKSGRRSRLISRVEAVQFRRYASPELRRLLLSLEESGARPDEMRRVTWDNVRRVDISRPLAESLRRGECYFELAGFKSLKQMKGAPPKRTIPISPRLGRLLARVVARGAMSGPVFRSTSGNAWTGNALRIAFGRLRRRVERITGTKTEGIVPYLYRHTIATRLATEGVNGRVLADFLGHRSLDMLAWYVHPSVTDLCSILRSEKRK